MIFIDWFSKVIITIQFSLYAKITQIELIVEQLFPLENSNIQTLLKFKSYMCLTALFKRDQGDFPGPEQVPEAGPALRGFTEPQPWGAVEERHKAGAGHGNFPCVCTILSLF